MIATGKAERDPSPDLRGALKTRTVQHMRRIGEAELPQLLAKIDAYEGEPVTRLALRLLTLRCMNGVNRSCRCAAAIETIKSAAVIKRVFMPA